MWHHVINRGLARRSVFEGRRDMRCFLACVARAVRRGEIEVHAYCLIPNHYHLLVRSPSGLLSVAMQRIQSQYVRYFNRSRHRDGALFRGRFFSKVAGTNAYRATLVKYIDYNPIDAGLAAASAHYPWGSRCKYARKHGPPWLTRSWIEEQVRGGVNAVRYEPLDYDARFGIKAASAVFAYLKNAIECQDPHATEAAAMLDGGADVREWMRRRRWAAEQARRGMCVIDTEVALKSAVNSREMVMSRRSGRSRPVSRAALIQAGLLRGFCGCSQAAVAAGMSLTRHQVRRLLRIHDELVDCDPEHAEAFAAAVRVAIAPPSV